MTEQPTSGCDIFIVASRAQGDYLNVLSIILFYWGKRKTWLKSFLIISQNVMCQAPGENDAEVIPVQIVVQH